MERVMQDMVRRAERGAHMPRCVLGGTGSLCLALTELRFSALARGRFAAAACGFSAAARVR